MCAYLCAYVCLSACTWVLMCVRMCACVLICVCMCACVLICVRMCACVLMCVPMCLSVLLCLPVSPDGLLLQSSTLADSATFQFADGQAATVSASYIEFAERLPLPHFAHLPEDEVRAALRAKLNGNLLSVLLD